MKKMIEVLYFKWKVLYKQWTDEMPTQLKNPKNIRLNLGKTLWAVSSDYQKVLQTSLNVLIGAVDMNKEEKEKSDEKPQ